MIIQFTGPGFNIHRAQPTPELRQNLQPLNEKDNKNRKGRQQVQLKELIPPQQQNFTPLPRSREPYFFYRLGELMDKCHEPISLIDH